MTILVLLVTKESNTRPPPITTKNKANHTTGPKETNNSAGTQDDFNAGNSDMEANHAQKYYVLPLRSSYTLTVKRSKTKNGDEKLNENTDSKTNEESVDKAFLEELERLKSQEKEATNASETLRKMFAQNDSQIPALEDIYDHSRDVIFTSTSYEDDSAEFDVELDEDMEYMDTEEAVNEGRQSIVDTARPDDDTARPDVSTARQELSTAGPTTPLTTTTIFDDEEITLADTLIKLKNDKAKGVAFKDSKDTNRPARSILTLKPLLTIDPKDKGKELQAEVERERQREEQASMDYIANLYDEVQEKIDAHHELAVRLTHEEQEKNTVFERAKLLSEYFERRKKQLAEERAAAIRNKPPTKTQLRRLMMTYLKNMGKITVVKLVRDRCPRGKVDLTGDEDPSDDDGGTGMGDSIGVSASLDFVLIGSGEDERRIRDMNKKAKKKAVIKIVPDEEGIIDYEVLDKRFPMINWESKFYHYDRHGAEGIYYRIFKSDGCSRWIKTFYKMVTRFNRLDLVELYNLVMQRFKTTTPEERRYPLTTKTIKRMLSLSLIVESTSDAAYDLLRFIQKQIDEFGGYDRGEKDL
nr:hypothetical protein [Tanacetum cinerariifolium]